MKKVNEDLVEQLLGELTLEEKISMIHGNGLFCTGEVTRLGIPSLKMADGPMGVRNDFENARWQTIGLSDDFVTYLPSNSAIASTWNKDLAHLAGKVLGEEARGRGKDIILAPGINIKRSPLCGRNFEYISEDPKLTEDIAVPIIQGIQAYDVAACVKHFAVNSQETDRLWVDTLVDERSLREIYYPGFKAAVQIAGSYSLMGAYNLLRGEHCCTSKYLLGDILRDEWGYDGTVISDWGGVHDTLLAAESELDIEMAVTYEFDEYFMANPLLAQIKAGNISEKVVDTKVRHILRLMLRLNMLGDYSSKRISGNYNTRAHQEAVLDIARESIVLLKNTEKRLPLSSQGQKKIAIIGQNAEKIHSNGGGSAEIKALYEISPLMGIKKLLGGNTQVSYAKGYYIPSSEEVHCLNWQATSTMHQEEAMFSEAEHAQFQKDHQQKIEKISTESKVLLNQAIQLASSCEQVIFVGGLNHDFDVEGLDRTDLKLPYGQDELIEALLQVNPNMTIVLVAGSPVEMPWVDKAKAIIWSWYAGMEGGSALAEVLFGITNPSGHLPETFPKKLEDTIVHQLDAFGHCGQVTHEEGIFVGYRYFDTQHVDPEFCFGHGLSYTSFEYTELQVKLDEKTHTPIKLEITIVNTGVYDGSEVVQVYVGAIDSDIVRPIHELRAFEKVSLKQGETKKITIDLHIEAFGFFNDKKKKFTALPGRYFIEVGSSSRDIRCTKTVTLMNHYEWK